jgi:hypothetical protein
VNNVNIRERSSTMDSSGVSSGPSRRLGWPGKVALVVFAIHALLLFFPPIPPDVKGSLWSYLLAAIAVALAAMEVHAHAPAIARSWRALRASDRALLGAAVGLGILALALAMRWPAPELFERWSRPEGIWEPLTLVAYLSGALLILAAARGRAAHDRRHLHLFALGYTLLLLEELDYLGIFGGLVGRVNGVYVGSPHDLIALAVEGLLPVWAVALAGVVAAVAVASLLRSGHLQPARFARTIFSWSGLWLLAGAAFLGVAQFEDLGIVYWVGQPRIEELLELVGATFLLGFAADLAADAMRDDPARAPAVQPERRRTMVHAGPRDR